MKYWITATALCFLITNVTHADSEATKTRQQVYTFIEEKSELLEYFVDEEKWQEAAPLGEKLANKVEQLHLLFPESSMDEGRARDSVWEEWDEFSKHLNKLEADFRSVSKAIAADNVEQAEKHLEAATSACRSCHISYRSLW
jgi:cytochrome c556